jgi:hypothetical protein
MVGRDLRAEDSYRRQADPASLRAAPVFFSFGACSSRKKARSPQNGCVRLGTLGERSAGAKLLLAAYGEAVDAKRWGRNGAAELQVVGDFGNIEEQVLEIAGNRDLFDGIGQLPA